jgi:hypothetical protein
MKLALAFSTAVLAALFAAWQTPIWDREGIPPNKGEAPRKGVARVPHAEQQILNTDKIFIGAHTSRSLDALASVLSEDFTFIGDQTLGRKEYLEGAAGTAYEFYETAETAVRVYGDAAVLTSRDHWKANRGGRVLEGRYNRLTVYIHKLGKWRAVATQVRPLPDK